MYTSLEMDHLIRQRNERLLREVRAERLRSRTVRGPRSRVRWVAKLLRRGPEPTTGTPRWIGERAAEEA